MTLTASSSTGVDRFAEPTRRRTVAQAVIEYLQVQFTEFDGERARLIPAVYGIFGHGISVGLAQALEEYGSDLPFIQGKNEQNMVHAAIGYAKASNRMSTFACTASAGPGAINMVTGAATASVNRLPVLLLPADVVTNRRADPVLQQLEHPIERDVSVNDCLRPVSRYFDRIMNPEQLLSTLPEAMRVLTDPVETGAVTICLPQDLQGEVADFPESFFQPRIWRISRRPAAQDQLEDALEVIAASKRPLIVVGGGVRYSAAQHEVAALSSEFGIPCAETFAGLSSGPHTELNLKGLGVTGAIGAKDIAAKADCIISVGSRLADFVTASYSIFENPDVTFVSLNVGGFDAHKAGAVPVVGDAKLSLEWLKDKLQERGYSPEAGYNVEIAAAQAHSAEMLAADLTTGPDEILNQAQVIHRLNEQTGLGDALVLGSGGVVEYIHKMWDTTRGTDVHMEYGFSCMGHEIPAGIGYRLARPDSPGDVFVLIGEHTYLMQPTELVTAAQEGQKIILVVMDNSGMQCIRSLQIAKLGLEFGTQRRRRNSETGRLDGEVLPLDVAANAASLGCDTWNVSSLDEFDAALAEARQSDRPCTIVVEVEPHRYISGVDAFWDVGVPKISEKQAALELSGAHVVDRRRQRFFGATTPPGQGT